MRRRGPAIALVGAGAAALLALSTLPISADESALVTVGTIADTTVTQVIQDGDNSIKGTLASCPRLCDGNVNGQRDALLSFAVRALPANVSKVRATLRAYTWDSTDARVVAYPAAGDARGTGAWAERPALGAALAAVNGVARGFNEWDVSSEVTNNGKYTFALLQESHHTRVYWASRENARAAIRPHLVLEYTITGRSTRTHAPSQAATRSSSPPTIHPTPGPARPTPGPTRPATAAPSPATTAPPRTTSQPTDTAPPGGWRLVWSDEFDGPTIDRAKWNLRTNEGRDIDRGCNTDSPRNTFTSRGVLTLRALRETTRCSSQTRQYTQSYLDTIGKASFTYGRFEIRAKSPNGPTNSRGLWPAFWLRPDDGGKGEIDVVELPGGASYYRAATQAIFYDYTPVKQDQRYTFATGHAGDGFHTYTTEWEPGALRWYIDGKQVYERNRKTTPWFDEAFNKPYNIRLNFQVGGWLGDPDTATTFPADFQVDYVRVWQR